MIEPHSATLVVQGSRRHVCTWGDPDAPGLLLVHGLLDHARNWDWVASQLCDRYYVIAPDLRGHGDSDWTGPASYALANHVMDLADIMIALELTDIRLIGHSLGGQLALRLAACYPERIAALCVIEGIELPIVREQRSLSEAYPLRLRRWIAGQQENRGRLPRVYGSLAEAETRMKEHNAGIDAGTIAHLVRHGVTRQARGGFCWKYDDACRQRAPEDARGLDLDDILSAIRCPTMLAYGEASWIPVPPAERLARIADHRVITFPGASHWLHHQKRDAFMAALDAFLQTSSERYTHA